MDDPLTQRIKRIVAEADGRPINVTVAAGSCRPEAKECPTCHGSRFVEGSCATDVQPCPTCRPWSAPEDDSEAANA